MQEQKPYHISVLRDEILEHLNPQPGGLYIDATFGGGGHTRAILEKEPECQVIAMDWDLVALEQNGEPLQEEFPDRLTLIWGNFAQIESKLKKIGVNEVDGILADFGTSQYQLMERPGFSFQKNTPLDMRMSPAHQKITAAHVIGKASEKELTIIFKEFGEEHQARPIARLIIKERTKNPIKTTKQLTEIVEKIAGPRGRKKIHPATKIFQALRIFVNKELDNITAFLPAAQRMLNIDGRLICMSFHSLEDRLVKRYFKEQSAGSDPTARIITPKALIPTKQEIERNPASRSAKMRVLEIIRK